MFASGLMHTLANARLAFDEGERAALDANPAMAAAVQATQDFTRGIASFVERRQAPGARRQAQFTGR